VYYYTVIIIIIMDLLETVASRYRDEGLLQRLLWIAAAAAAAAGSGSSCNSGGGGRGGADDDASTDAAAASAASSSLSDEAYRMAERSMKSSGNVRRYREVFRNGGGGGGGGGVKKNSGGGTAAASSSSSSSSSRGGIRYDAVWADRQEAENRRAHGVLESRLRAANSNLNKDSIRTALLALSEHDARVGDLAKAFHGAVRAKDNCTSRQQAAAVSIRVLELALYTHNYASVRDYSTKIGYTIRQQQQQSSSSPAATTSSGGSDAAAASAVVVEYKVAIAAGLEALFRRDYDRAAAQFVSAATRQQQSSSSSSSHQQQQGGNSNNPSGVGGGGASSSPPPSSMEWPAVLCPEDVATYAGFLALAQRPRRDVSSLAEHPEALELAPAVREALSLFALSKYRECWKALETSVLPALRYDLFLSPHLEKLKNVIRQKILLHYWMAYRKVGWDGLQEELGRGVVPSEEFFVRQWAYLIGSGAAPPGTRLDLPARMLVRDGGDGDEDSRDRLRLDRTKAKLRQTTTQVMDDVYSMVVRVACVENDLVVGGGDASSSSSSSRRVGGAKRRGRPPAFRGTSSRGGGAAMAEHGGGIIGGIDILDVGDGESDAAAEGMVDDDDDDDDDDIVDEPMMDIGHGDDSMMVDEPNPEDLY